MKALSRIPGFTIIEVMVALALGAMIMLCLRVAVDQTTATALRLSAARSEAERPYARERMLRALVRDIDTDSAGTPEGVFYADARQVRFTSWCLQGPGWLRQCRGQLELIGGDASATLAVTVDGHPSIRFSHLPPSAKFRFLAPSDTGYSWMERWDRGILPPRAIAIVAGDTLILRIGDRG